LSCSCAGCRSSGHCTCAASAGFVPVPWIHGGSHVKEPELTTFKGDISFDLLGQVEAKPSGFLEKHVQAIGKEEEALTIEQFLTKAQEFFCLNGIRNLLEVKLDGKDVYLQNKTKSRGITSDYGEDLDAGLDNVRNTCNFLKVNKISISAATSNEDFHSAFELTFNRRHSEGEYSATLSLTSFPSILYPSGSNEIDPEEKVSKKVKNDLLHRLKNPSEKAQFENKYGVSLRNMINGYDQSLRTLFQIKDEALNVQSGPEILWSVSQDGSVSSKLSV
jgi:hypothetical protein